MLKIFLILILQITMPSISLSSIPSEQWDKNFSLPGSHEIFSVYNRSNILNLPPIEFKKKQANGLTHALFYPVKTTAFLLSLDALKRYFQPTSEDHKYKQLVYKVLENRFDIDGYISLFNQVGMHNFPEDNKNNYNVPYIPEDKKNLPMGTTLIERNGARGLTFSCAGCHSSDLFGVKVIGLTNRFPRANEAFSLLKKVSPLVTPKVYNQLLSPEKPELELYKNTAHALKFIGAKKPLTLGLDTSLAHTALSLYKRADDEYASLKSQNPLTSIQPLKFIPADSKPGVWWNLKYKTRWLLDGSLISGNPIYTNLLWNEIGRGSDLKELEKWLDQNDKIIEDLTAATFSITAPKYIDFFGVEKIDLNSAKRGDKIFHQSCHKCHGVYEKAWNDSTPLKLQPDQLLKTTRTHYFKKTPVMDVKTDPYRYQGMKYFYKRLNKLKISKKHKIEIKPQKGYVPPPLEGIWARWPYFHNNSVPSLCELLTVESKRVGSYYALPPIDKEDDFDHECNGYPKVNNLRPDQKKKKYLYSNNKAALSNKGHSQGILEDFQGNEYYSKQDKVDLINFMKTL